jgi:hypothetical protein
MKHISEVLPDALVGMRELWREYGLNNSAGAAMRITYADGTVKQHGTMPYEKSEGQQFAPASLQSKTLTGVAK